MDRGYVLMMAPDSKIDENTIRAAARNDSRLVLPIHWYAFKREGTTDLVVENICNIESWGCPDRLLTFCGVCHDFSVSPVISYADDSADLELSSFMIYEKSTCKITLKRDGSILIRFYVEMEAVLVTQ